MTCNLPVGLSPGPCARVFFYWGFGTAFGWRCGPGGPGVGMDTRKKCARLPRISSSWPKCSDLAPPLPKLGLPGAAATVGPLPRRNICRFRGQNSLQLSSATGAGLFTTRRVAGAGIARTGRGARAIARAGASPVRNLCIRFDNCSASRLSAVEAAGYRCTDDVNEVSAMPSEGASAATTNCARRNALPDKCGKAVLPSVLALCCPC